MMIRRARFTGESPGATATTSVARQVNRSASLIKPKPLVAARPRLASKPATERSSVLRASVAEPPSLVSSRPALVSPAVDRTAARTGVTAQPVATTPVQRWQAAIARMPLEPARPFPSDVRPLVAELTGSADRPSFTTGPATRAALQAAGAHGATTGTVVHLPEMPGARSDRIGVLAHELSHARNPVTRPRFLLRSATGAMDADERTAHGVGARVQRAVTHGGGARDRGSSGGTSMLGAVVARSVRSGSSQAPGGSSSVSGGSPASQQNSGSSAVRSSSAGPRVASVMRSALTDRLADQAQSFVGDSDAVTGLRQRAQQAKTVAAGIVDNLPVGGAGAAGLVDAVRPGGLASLPSALAGPASAVADEVSAGVADRPQVMEFASGAVPGVGGVVDEVSGAGAQALSHLTSATTTQAAGLVSGAAGAGQQVAGAAPGAAGALSHVDLDRITAAIEERLLRQLERRGGRYAGVF
jgi:uncharacterized protein DUF4157